MALGPGGAALSAHVDAVDGRPLEVLFPQAPHRFRGGGPLRQVAIHRVQDHWHLVTYGLSELDSKESDDPEVSGWGFELTFRLARDEPDPAPPLWAVDFLANLAAYVWRSRLPFAPGHHLDLRGPIRLDAQTEITAAVVVTDPALGSFDGPLGLVEFLQVVGLTADELELCRAWSTAGVVELLGRDNPLLVTGLGRQTVSASPATRAEIDQRVAAEGSALTELHVGTLWWRRRGLRRLLVLRMGAGAAAGLGPALRRELIGPDASFQVIGSQGTLRFIVAAQPGWVFVDEGLELRVTLEQVGVVADLFTGRLGWGRLDGYPGLRFQVVA